MTRTPTSRACYFSFVSRADLILDKFGGGGRRGEGLVDGDGWRVAAGLWEEPALWVSQICESLDGRRRASAHLGFTMLNLLWFHCVKPQEKNLDRLAREASI